MSRQEGEKRCISESNLLDVNGFNVKSELSRSSGNDRAAGQSTYIQGWILHLYCTGLCETFNKKIIKKNDILNFLNMYTMVSHTIQQSSPRVEV